jgi:DNA-binding cell septation regulator SpoVG
MATLPSMEVTARPVEPVGSLRGFASVTVGGIKINDFKIVQNKDGNLFVGMPSKPDKSSDTGYRHTVTVDKELKDEFSALVIGAYQKAVEQNKTRVADKPERMEVQKAKAKEEADKHNAKQPKKEQGAQKREEVR